MFTQDYIRQILSSNTEEANDAVVSITKFLMKDTLTKDNSYLFLKILEKNIKQTADIMFERRGPDTFFSTLKPFRELVQMALNIIVKYKPSTLYSKILISCLGILQNTYKKPDDGFKIKPLMISDLQHIGKYLILNDTSAKNIIIDILEDVWCLSLRDFKQVRISAKNIIDTYQDNTKKIGDVIPHNLLV